jgi:hypothetical protein
LVLRERIKGDESRVTLKYRTPNLARAASTKLKGLKDRKFEEDVVPLTISTASSDKRAIADPPSMRSLFSVSGDLKQRPETLGDLFEKASAVEGMLTLRNEGRSTRLEPGARIEEVAFDDITVALDEDESVEFSVSVWKIPQGGAGTRRLVELSFKYEDEPMPRGVARRAEAMFMAMQRLSVAKLDQAPKTREGLPASCRDQD